MRCLLLAAILVAGCAGPGAQDAGTPDAPPMAVHLADPLAPGPHGVVVHDYAAGEATLGGNTSAHDAYEYTEPLVGRLWAPDGPGPYPVLAFLHGQHSTCQDPTGQEAVLSADSCDDEQGLNSPYPNHEGYGYLGTFLAGHGYVVVSILGHETNQISNSVNDRAMWARGELFLETLEALQEDGLGVIDPALLDMERIGLMGHSRGGEGAAFATVVNAGREEPFSIRGIVTLAPTDFFDPVVEHVALMSLLPYCDGDVDILHGAQTFDHARYIANDTTPKVQVLAMGANHNHYNTKWGAAPIAGVVPDGDDAGTRTAGPCAAHDPVEGRRLTVDETLQQSIVQVGGFLRWTVGGEAGLAPYFTGQAGLPSAACPAAWPCDRAMHVSYQAPAAQRTTVWDAGQPDALSTHLLGGPVSATGLTRFEQCQGSDCPTGDWPTSDATVAVVSWNGPASIAWQMPAPIDGRDFLSFRAAVSPWTDENPKDVQQDLRVVLRTDSGAEAGVLVSQHSQALYYPPGDRKLPEGLPVTAMDDTAKTVLNMVRVPMAAFDIDGAIVEVRLEFGATPSGTLLVTDLQFQDDPVAMA